MAEKRTEAASSAVAVTYIPDDREEFAPSKVTWNHITFRANVPVMLDPNNKAHGYMVPLPQERVMPTGEITTKHVDTWVSMIDLAKGNPEFKVDGFPRVTRARPAGAVPRPGEGWYESNKDMVDA